MIYTLVAISLVTITLIAGVIIMAIGGKLNKKYSSKLMSLRVVFQGLAICILALGYFLTKK